MKNILFVGNSFTYVNDLPATYKALSERYAIPVYVDSVTCGGAYLRQFADPTHELGIRLREKYAERDWDIIILQDQSFNPAHKPDDHISAVQKIVADLGLNGKTIMLYQTWAYRDGSEKLGSAGMSYERMRTALRDAYMKSAEAVGGICVPVGDAFAVASGKGIDLYDPDAYHPSPAGTYLAACVFLHSITGRLASGSASDSLEGRVEDAFDCFISQ